MITYLSASDIVDIGLTLDEAMDIVRDSLCEHGDKQVENPPKISVHPMADAFITAMPAYLKRKQAAGMKWVAGFPANVPKGLPTISGFIILNDAETGMVTSLLDGTYITALRTVAVSALAAKHLANPEPEVLAIVGCGLQGRYHAAALKHVRPSLSVVHVFDTYEPSVASFAEEMKTAAPGFTIHVCDTPEKTVKGADIVVTSTGKLLEPIFDHEWVKEGALVLPVHTLGWDAAAPSALDKLICDDWDQFCAYSEGWYKPLPEAPHAELGEVIAGHKPGRENAEERIIDFNAGLAIHDVLMGQVMAAKAGAAGIGTDLAAPQVTLPMPIIAPH